MHPVLILCSRLIILAVLVVLVVLRSNPAITTTETRLVSDEVVSGAVLGAVKEAPRPALSAKPFVQSDL